MNRGRLVVLLGALACALVPPADAGATVTPAPLHYRVRTDAALRHMSVDVCFRGAPPRVLIPGVSAAGAALLEARAATGRRLPAPRGRIALDGVAPGTCVQYRIDLEVALSAVRFADRYGHDVVTSAGAWLWRPARLGTAAASLELDLPAGVSAALPWPRVDGAYRLPRSAFQRASFTAFGRFQPHRFQRGGAQVEVVRLGDGWRLDDAGAERALSLVMDGVSTVRGRFPVRQVLVLLVPSFASGVHFGMVRRGGGCSVAFLTGRESSAETLERSWVTWHELSHLLLPPIEQRDAWLYEGLATYYQEVLPARMGVQAPEQAWSSLVAGFDRGFRGSPADPLGRASATMMQTGAFLRVYWSGTAYVLEADVALRQRGSSLDRVLARAAALRDHATTWTAERLLAALDRGLQPPVLTPLGAGYTSRVGHPDLRALFARLGVERDGAGVRLRAAELSTLRDAIVRPVR